MKERKNAFGGDNCHTASPSILGKHCDKPPGGKTYSLRRDAYDIRKLQSASYYEITNKQGPHCGVKEVI